MNPEDALQNQGDGKLNLEGGLLSHKDAKLNRVVIAEIREHLHIIRNSFNGYFSIRKLTLVRNCIRDPFLFTLQDMDVDD